MQIPLFEIEGYEADDVLGALSVKAAEQRLQVTILSGDNDLLQLVNPHTQEVFVLIRHDVYKLTSKILKTWGDPEDDDLIEANHESR